MSTSVEVEVDYMSRCLLRHLLVKCGHKDVVEKELLLLQDTVMRVSGNYMRCAVFGRLCGLFSPMPHPMTQLLVVLKASSWHAVYPKLDWSESVRRKGLPMGPTDTTGEGPVARDGVVGYDLAVAQVRATCTALQLRFDLALDWLSARLLIDHGRNAADALCVSVEVAMAAVTAQLDVKTSQLATVFTARFRPQPNLDDPLPEDAPLGAAAEIPLLTLPALHLLISEVHGAVTEAQALEVYVSLARESKGRAATGQDFARGVIQSV